MNKCIKMKENYNKDLMNKCTKKKKVTIKI